MQAVSEHPRSLALVTVATVFTFLCFVTTGLRLVIRRLDHLLGWDDWTALLSFCLLLVQWIFVLVAVHFGLGMPKEFVSARNVEFVLKYMWLLQFWCFLTVALPKISICIFILRIKNYGWLKWYLYCMIAGLLMTNLICIVILLAECSPVKAYWMHNIGSCWAFGLYNRAVIASVSFSILSDVSCSLLPIIVLWNVKISLRAKVGVSGLMSIGLISTVAAIARALVGAKENGTDDPTYNLALPEICAILEQVLSLIGANCALCRHAYKVIRNRKKSSKDRTARTNGPQGTGTLWRLDSSSRARSIHDTPLRDQNSNEELIRRQTEVFVIKEPNLEPSAEQRGAAGLFEMDRRGPSRTPV